MVVDTPTREEIHGIVERYRAFSKVKRSRMTLESYVRQELSSYPEVTLRRGKDTVSLLDHIIGDLESYG
jgi:hypothetical protein